MPLASLHLAAWFLLIFAAIWHFTEVWVGAAQDQASAPRGSTLACARALWLGGNEDGTMDKTLVKVENTVRTEDVCRDLWLWRCDMGESLYEHVHFSGIWGFLKVWTYYSHTSMACYKRMWHIKEDFLFWDDCRFTCTCKKCLTPPMSFTHFPPNVTSWKW